MTGTLFYVHDPMCSWCYAFQTSLTALEKHLPPSIQLKKLVGGLAPDSTAVMPKAMQQQIQQTWRRIEQTVPHVRFNHDYWAVNTPIRSTYPSCRAVIVAARQGQGYQDNMISAIQMAYYQQAKNPSLQPVLLECAEEAGLDTEKFAQELASAEIEAQLQNQIRLSLKLGVSSFPSLRLQQLGQLLSITVDYLDFEVMLDEIRERCSGSYQFDRHRF